MDKWLKKSITEEHNRIKPTACQKFMRLVMSSSLVETSIGQELILELSSAKYLEWKHEVRDLPVNNCFIWERCTDQQFLTSTGLDDGWQMENEVVQILTYEDLHKAVRRDSLGCLTKRLRDKFPNKRYTLLIVGERKKIAAHSRSLTELLIREQVCVLQLPGNAQKLLEKLQCITKAIAEIPYKEKESALQTGFKKFLANDNKNCVRVEGNNGYVRLWQQHLNRLPLVTLEVAETLISQYSNPKRLLDDYQSNSGAIDEIADLKIKRSGPIPLQTDRRIGRVMSEKLHTLYHSRDPNTLL